MTVSLGMKETALAARQRRILGATCCRCRAPAFRPMRETIPGSLSLEGRFAVGPRPNASDNSRSRTPTVLASRLRSVERHSLWKSDWLLHPVASTRRLGALPQDPATYRSSPLSGVDSSSRFVPWHVALVSASTVCNRWARPGICGCKCLILARSFFSDQSGHRAGRLADGPDCKET